MIEFIKVRKKPVEVDAFQLTENVYLQLASNFRFIGNGKFESMSEPMYIDKNRNNGLFICTLEGEMQANIGDWIIKGVNDEIYPCKDDIFKKTYDIV